MDTQHHVSTAHAAAKALHNITEYHTIPHTVCRRSVVDCPVARQPAVLVQAAALAGGRAGSDKGEEVSLMSAVGVTRGLPEQLTRSLKCFCLDEAQRLFKLHDGRSFLAPLRQQPRASTDVKCV